jgi:hypothetical protein
MLKKSASVVLSRSSPCNVPQGYASVADLPAALLNGLFEHPARRSLIPDRTKKEREESFVSGFIQTFHVLRFTFHG